MTQGGFIPDSGDLIWTDFDPTRGREQAGRRARLSPQLAQLVRARLGSFITI